MSVDTRWVQANAQRAARQRQQALEAHPDILRLCQGEPRGVHVLRQGDYPMLTWPYLLGALLDAGRRVSHRCDGTYAVYASVRDSNGFERGE